MTDDKMPWASTKYQDGRTTYELPESHALAFRELCRRVVKREGFTAYAAKVWEEIFDGGGK